jgi:hypothetical protein
MKICILVPHYTYLKRRSRQIGWRKKVSRVGMGDKKRNKATGTGVPFGAY